MNNIDQCAFASSNLADWTIEKGVSLHWIRPRHERIMLQFFPIILLRIAQKFPQYYSRHSLIYSLIFDIIYSLMFTTYSLIMAQMEFGIVGSGVRVKITNFCSIFDIIFIITIFFTKWR